jgi:hypothetical protein
MEIARQVLYGKEGAILTVAEFSGFPSSGDVLFPKSVTIHRPVEDVDLKITFVNVEPNAELPGADFQLSQPEGSQLIQMTGSALKH